jgi:hypothetical protein
MSKLAYPKKMKNLSFLIIIFIILSSGLNSCKKDPGAVVDLGYNYFPEEAGRYVIYNVDSIFYKDNYYPAKKDSFKFQIKEKVQSIFTDNEGRPTMRLERYIKYYNPAVPYSAMNWTLRNVWVQNKTARTAEKVEENLRYIKLLFPVDLEKEWNGNAYNTLEEENYSYNFIDKERTIGNIHFDSVLQVDQHNETNLVLQNIHEEKYARNVGLIYKRVIDVKSQYPSYWNSSPPMPYLEDSLEYFYNQKILDRVSSGYQYTMTVSTYGVE